MAREGHPAINTTAAADALPGRQSTVIGKGTKVVKTSTGHRVTRAKPNERGARLSKKPLPFPGV